MASSKYATIRNAVVGAAMAAVAVTSSSAKAEPNFSNEECRAIIIVADQVFKKSEQPLSQEFKQSVASFVAPNGKLTCTGPKNIVTPKNQDIDAFNAMRLILSSLDKPHPIDLQANGVKSVKSANVASLN